MSIILEANDVSFSFGALNVLRGVSVTVCKGTVTGIIGPNGAGKSTLMRILAGTLSPASGSVILDGKPVARMHPGERARHIAVVPQETHIPFPFTALEIVLMGRAPYLPAFGFESRHDVDVAMAALNATDCTHLAGRDIAELSGGERRRVIIARALAQETSILLLDEPMSFLDLRHSSELARLLREKARSSNLASVAVMHDLNLAAAFCDRIIILKDGSISAEGTPAETISSGVIGSAFNVRVSTGRDPATGAPYCIPAQ